MLINKLFYTLLVEIPDATQLTEYESAPENVATAITGLTSKQLYFKLSGSDWSINEVIVHLADTETFFFERMRKIIVDDNPTLQSFDQDEWAKKLSYNEQDYRFALDLLIAQRKSTAILLRLLPHNSWERKGIHENKEKTLHDIFMTALHHIPHHVQQITDIKNNPRFPENTS